MPGIAGVITGPRESGRSVVNELETMAILMMHGPTHQVDAMAGDGYGLARVGSSFMNPQPQPVSNSLGTLHAIFYGELSEPARARADLQSVGHKLTTDNDAEIVLRWVEHYGPNGIAGLAGSYVGMIYDSTRRVAHLFTDRLGTRGCYYVLTAEGTFYFASEFKAIAAIHRGSLDTVAVAQFLNCGQPLFERTFHRDVAYLQHGTVLTVANGSAKARCYWDFPVSPQANESQFDDFVTIAGQSLTRAIARQGRQSEGIGVFLSGGLDSRSIVAGMRQGGRRPPTFTYGTGQSTEELLATRVSQTLGVPNERLRIPPDHLVDWGEIGCWYTDGMLTCHHFVWLPGLSEVERSVNCIISGYLGDTFLGGISLSKDSLTLTSDAQQRARVQASIAPPFLPDIGMCFQDDFRNTLEESYEGTRQEVGIRIGQRGAGMELERMIFLTRLRRQINIAMGGIIGARLDVKYPFADYDLMDLYASLPTKWRLHSKLYKAMFCQAFPELSTIPCISAKTHHVLCRPDRQLSHWRIRQRWIADQMRFLIGRLSLGRISLPANRTYQHDDHWYRTNKRLRQWVEGMLLDERTLDRGMLDRAGLRRLIERQMTRGYYFETLSRLLAFEQWHRFFVDGQLPDSVRADLPRRRAAFLAGLKSAKQGGA